MLSSAVYICALGFFMVLLFFRKKRSASIPLPPGPRGYPVIGNIHDIPHHYAWHTYADWAKRYGDVMHLKVFGTSTIILNSFKATMELLEKRSSNYSDRPRMIMASELMDWDWDFAHMHYTDRWRRHRRRFHQYFQPRNLASYYPIQKKVAVNLLEQLLQTPENYSDHVKQYISSVVLSAAYGYEVEAENDFYVALVHKAVPPLLHVVHAGNYLVEYIPILKYVPEWFPGADFKRKAAIWALDTRSLVDIPFNMVKEDIAKGVAKQSFVYDNLEKIKTEGNLDLDTEEEIIKNCAGMVYLAGSDTTTSLMHSWLLAMVNFPEVQRKAQDEIDKVVGRNRLPEFNDRPSMPYIEAMLLETMRWGIVTPLALPHRVIQEDVYEGYRIPAGATVVANVWAILHDENIYPEPSLYQPERFIAKDGKDNVQMDPIIAGAFGYGRRICPGRYLAMNTAWLAMTSILSAFNISNLTDANGKVIEAKIEFGDGLNSHPKPFQIKVSPRSNDTKKFIETAKLDISTVTL